MVTPVATAHVSYPPGIPAPLIPTDFTSPTSLPRTNHISDLRCYPGVFRPTDTMGLLPAWPSPRADSHTFSPDESPNTTEKPERHSQHDTTLAFPLLAVLRRRPLVHCSNAPSHDLVMVDL